MKHNSPSQSLILIGLALLLAVALVAGCAQKAAPAEKRVETTVVVEKEVLVEAEKVVEVAPTPAPHVSSESGQPADDTGATLPAAYRVGRMIIKNAELKLLVADTDVAIDLTTQIAADTFGYILSARTWYQGNFKYATITIGVPVNEFENALRRLRGLALKVMDENASGTDVTDQYVDLESRLRNLEATEERIRSFLDKATTVEESLQINKRLSEITDQIEEVKGRMNYLKDRAAYSTITVHISPEVPTPTPAPTATPTPMPTPVAWRPGETFQRASYVLTGILRVIGNALIWIVVLFGPFIIPVALVLLLVLYLRKRWRRPE